MLPKGIKSSGFPAVDATCRQLGLVFDPWQADLNRCILAKGKNGQYAADLVAMSIPRQVGKTWDIGAVVFALCVIHPGLTVVWTAHRFKVARETFDSLKGVALSPALMPHVDPDDITTGAGNESIKFRNGSRIVFAARERGAVRGFSKIGVLVLDEGQILTEHALADLVPTTNQAENPLIIVMGTPPKPTDPGEVFTRLRSEALGGVSDGVLYVEFSAERGSDRRDRKAWAAANASYPRRTPARAIERLLKLLSPEDFDREALGIWDELDGSVINMTTWADAADPSSTIIDPVVFAVDVAPDRSTCAISAAGLRSDGVPHIEVVRYGRSVAWAVAEIERLTQGFVVVDGRSAAASLLPALQAVGIEPLVTSSGDMARACGMFYDAVESRGIRHLGDPVLEKAIRSAGKRPLSDAWAFDRRRGDITPLVSAVLALFGLSTIDTTAKEAAPWAVYA